MSSDREAAEAFGRYIDDAIRTAGYRSISAFARAAELDPSVVARWIRAETNPTPATLRKAGLVLRIPESELFAVAFPSSETPAPGPPLPDAIRNLADEYRLSDPADRDLILEQVRRVTEWARYRRTAK